MAIVFKTPGARTMDALNAASQVVETSRGTVEFALHGDAPYVLIFHGTPQGHHASFMGEPFEAEGFGTITPSRPGYLRTPLETGRTFAEQADAAAALLDTLGIDQVAAYGVSGGGPSSIEFAARHPDRVACLVLEVAISQRFAPDVSPLILMLARSSIAFRIQARLLRWFPRFAVSQMMKVESTHDSAEVARITADVVGDPDKMDILRRLAEGPPFGMLRAGFDNDLEQFASIAQLPLDRVNCPTLVVHGTHDGDVPFAHAEHSAAGIRDAELFTVENGWHLLRLSDGDDAYLRAEIDFLRQHLLG
ncbi:MAG: alpha/beta hydrolase [Chloroflexota bacterium]|nr:alpha/beta hydrolase [Chloroflexota bacterium]MDE2893859.1 alpha/beta hydrolase [Chloroflexota bacterium]